MDVPENLAGRRILVVEDTFLVADMIADLLETAGCIVVGPAARLPRGTELAEHEPLDFALLDINLAGAQSFPIAAILRRRHIPFAFLTGYSDDAVPVDFRDSVCLAKPFHSRELLGLLNEQLGAGA